MLNIQTLPVGDLEANCFLVSDSEKNAVIIDPGAEAPRILSEIKALALKPLAILLTHAHFDHFGAAADVIEALQIPLYVHPLDRALVLSSEYSLARTSNTFVLAKPWLALPGSPLRPNQGQHTGMPPCVHFAGSAFMLRGR